MRFGSKSFLALSLALAIVTASRPSRACSVAMCAGRGVEVEPNFAVVVKLQRAGLTGAKIEIKASATGSVIRTELTDRSGRVSMRRLAPGDYWITVSYLGVIAGEQCFHVVSQPSMTAKASLRYRWGDYGVSMRSVSGTLQEWQPGKSGLPIWNLAHGVNAPIRGATALLQNAVTREVRRSESDAKGEFGFGPVPDGIYVLHVEGGVTTRSYEPSDIIIPVSHTTGRESLVLTLREDGCAAYTFSPRWQ